MSALYFLALGKPATLWVALLLSMAGDTCHTAHRLVENVREFRTNPDRKVHSQSFIPVAWGHVGMLECILGLPCPTNSGTQISGLVLD